MQHIPYDPLLMCNPGESIVYKNTYLKSMPTVINLEIEVSSRAVAVEYTD